MYDAFFSNSFCFRTYRFETYHYTDNRNGICAHFLAYMMEGRCKIVTEKDTVTIKKGDIFYIPNGCKYQSFWFGEPEIQFISLRFLFLPNFQNTAYPLQVLPHDAKAVELFYRLSGIEALKSSDIGTFYTLVGLLQPGMEQYAKCRTKEIVDRTKEYLIEHPFAGVSELSQNCAISESALYSAFQKASDTTLKGLRNRMIMEKARILLVTTDKSIEEISQELRFSSCSYFRKIFKQHFLVTPREMRKMYKI